MNNKELEQAANKVMGIFSSATTAFSIHLGDKLGLYKEMMNIDKPITSKELSNRTGLHERFIREWLYCQASSGILNYEMNQGQSNPSFLLPKVMAALLADEENSPMFTCGAFEFLPGFGRVLPKVIESFKTGKGFDYDEGGEELAESVERFLTPFHRLELIPKVLPQMPGVIDRLKRGMKVVDVGCGTGVALFTLARAFPNSDFHGYENSACALNIAKRRASKMKLPNVRFHNVDESDTLPNDHSVGLVLTLDVLHDMARPDIAVKQIRDCISGDGAWLILDTKATDNFMESMQNPIASMCYGVSTFICLPSSLSEDGGLGLGTMGFTEELAQKMVRKEGFTQFRKLSCPHPKDSIYEVRL